jgi:hypothetical protein
LIFQQPLAWPQAYQRRLQAYQRRLACSLISSLLTADLETASAGLLVEEVLMRVLDSAQLAIV